MSTRSYSHTANPLPLPRDSPSHDEYDEEDEPEDDISELTFDNSIYTQSQTHGVELSEQNVRRFGTHRGYAPALSEDSRSGCDSDEETGRRDRDRGRVMSRKEIMSYDLAKRQDDASSFENRFYNIATLLLLAQIVVMMLMIREGGILPLAENVMLGPSVGVMIDYGAQQGGLVIFEHQWWRLGSALFVHAGLLHLACNAYVQWQVCGYLCQLWGRFSWLLVFLLSGLAGNVYSVIRSPDLVGVGASGAVMGVLAAWAVFILLTWDLVSASQRAGRNQQLCSLLVNIVIVIVIGQLDMVDGNAHLGGLIQGALLGGFLLSDESSSVCTKWALRTLTLAAMAGLYLWAFLIAWPRIDPSEETLLQYE